MPQRNQLRGRCRQPRKVDGWIVTIWSFAILFACGGCRREGDSGKAPPVTSIAGANSDASELPAANDPTRPPVASVLSPNVDLGEIALPDDLKLPVRFEIWNRGEGILRLLKIVPSCRCADVKVVPLAVEPDQKATVQSNVLLKPDPAPGSAAFEVYTNDPERFYLRLTVQWKTIGPVEFETNSFILGELKPQESVERSVRIVLCKSALLRGVRVIGIHSDCPEIECSLDEFTDPPTIDSAIGERVATHCARLTILVGTEPGEKHGIVRLLLSSDEVATPRLYITWACKSEILVEPSSLVVGVLTPGTPVDRELMVTRWDKSDFSIERVEVEGEGLSAALEMPTDSNSEHRIKVRLIPPERAGIVRGKVKVVASNGAEPVNVSVFGLVRSIDPQGD